MSSTNSRPAPRRGNDQILTIDWTLLWRRAKTRIGQFITSLRHRAGQTEYIPPVWMQRLRLSWFRLGLIGLAFFVFTQKQIDFTLSVGKEGIALGNTSGRHMATQSNATTTNMGTSQLSVIPMTGSSAKVSAWSIDQLDARQVKTYIGRFEKVAQGEEDKFSIPAPAKMALAILASEAGQSASAKRDNNHFGAITNQGYYDNAWMNWRAHSELVDQRYPQLAAESVNYQQWIAALAKTNYSADPKLANKLMDIIERFELARL